jgi:hypothetical protein
MSWLCGGSGHRIIGEDRTIIFVIALIFITLGILILMIVNN